MPTPKRPAAARGTRATPPAPAALSVSPAQFARHQSALAILMNTFHLRHMLHLYAAFDGDLLEAIVLGEVAHHNVSGLRTGAADLGALSATLRTAAEAGAALPLLPTNAFSIALATGIPRQTVRRKVEALLKKQFLRRDGRANLFVTPRAREHFAGFNAEAVADLLATARDIAALTAGDATSPARRGRSRPPVDVP